MTNLGALLSVHKRQEVSDQAAQMLSILSSEPVKDEEVQRAIDVAGRILSEDVPVACWAVDTILEVWADDVVISNQAEALNELIEQGL